MSIDLKAFQSFNVCSKASLANFGGSKSCAGKAGVPIDLTFADLDFESEDLLETYWPCSELWRATVLARNNSMCSPLECNYERWTVSFGKCRQKQNVYVKKSVNEISNTKTHSLFGFVAKSVSLISLFSKLNRLFCSPGINALQAHFSQQSQ